MVYRNAAGQPRERCMWAAYVLVKEMGWTQVNVATGFKVSQPTVAQWIKEVEFRNTIKQLTIELEEGRQLAQLMQTDDAEGG